MFPWSKVRLVRGADNLMSRLSRQCGILNISQPYRPAWPVRRIALLFLLVLRLCLDGESSSGESPVPQIRPIGQFLLSHLFSSEKIKVLKKLTNIHVEIGALLCKPARTSRPASSAGEFRTSSCPSPKYFCVQVNRKFR
jgi:hypothetical protein